ncbi:hypothetical protein RRF57_011763 [Xylaria bambusicola]|uniref:Uncharacterized protein n=1 Tax=Xylaria bambusicola TaxID=326684 RepID=A0AAN7ZDB4_9PEZI
MSLAATLAIRAAANFNIVGPFALRVTPKTNSDVDGYLWACHAGAATEGLCYAAGAGAVSGSVYEFYYNYTFDEESLYPGFISYVFPYQGADGSLVKVPSLLQLYPSYSSNVNLALIPPGSDGGTSISLDEDSGQFYMGLQHDDTRWNSTIPIPETPRNVSNFHICYQWTGGYWYRSLAWVSGYEGAAPQNPSCEPVNLGIESLGSS